MKRRLIHTGRTWPTTDETIEDAVVALSTIRLVEQQAWLDKLPYQNAEHKCIVKDAHEHLSEDARALIGLVLHYPDIVENGLKTTAAANSSYIRKTNRGNVYNKGRTLNYIKKEREIPPHRAKLVFAELREFVGTLARYTRANGYSTVATGAMLEIEQ